MARTIRKLTLARETVRQLTGGEPQAAQAASLPIRCITDGHFTCVTCNC